MLMNLMEVVFYGHGQRHFQTLGQTLIKGPARQREVRSDF